MSKRGYLWLVGLALIAAMQLPVISRANSRCTSTYAPGIVLVGFHDDVTAVERWADLNIIATIPGIRVSALRVLTGQECAALEMLRHDPGVAFAELDYAVHATETRFLVPNDPGWANQWGPAKIGAPVAWSVLTGTPDVVIAVLDSGVQLNHEDLADNLWANPGETPGNGIDDDGNGKVDDFWGWHFYHEWAWDGETYTYLPKEDNHVADDYGHGTHVAGIAGAKINNGIGIAGMAGDSRLMTVKVLDQYGNGWYSDVAQGIVYAVDSGARIINLSMGGTPSSETLQEAVNYARAHGVLVVAASGNDGGAVLYPAACEHVLAVAATNQDDNRASFSNHGSQVDVAAPGVDISSTWYRGNYFVKSGTSMATPHVSGLAALICSARLDLSVEQVTGIITGTAADVNGGILPGWDEYLGWGRVEAGWALSATTHSGTLNLTTSRPQLIVGEAAIITATDPLTTTSTAPFTFTASGGTVSPTLTALTYGVATTTLVAGPMAGMTIVTGTNGTLTGTLFLRRLPGPMVSTTLVPSTREVSLGETVIVTATVSDSFGNLAPDGTLIYWAANMGTVVPMRSLFYEGAGRTTFTVSDTYGPATITASLESGSIATTTLNISPPYQRYLPIILCNSGN